MRKLTTADLETDPFSYGKLIQPFLAGYYDGKRVVSFWGQDCVARFFKALDKESEPLTIYVHNGGRFDFFYFIKYFGGGVRIINGRIVQAFYGKHEFRDSFAIMPFPLADYDKDAIDYNLFDSKIREQHRAKILKYFHKDLTALHELVVAFHSEFGDKLTIGAASMKQIKKRHKFTTGNEEYDAKFRTDFYFGGRNQVFRSGVINGQIRVYDVNSMYPYVMHSFLHPIGTAYTVSNRIERDTVFVVAEGKNYGAFPTREKDNSLNFTRESGIFHTTIHEWKAALDTGAFKPTRVIKTYGWRSLGCFDDFVTHFFDARKLAKQNGDKIRTIFYKYVLNSGYGKFAQNPDNYFDWYITERSNRPPDWHVCNKTCVMTTLHGVPTCVKMWSPSYMHDDYIIWQRPLQTKNLSWYNIATGASITGASRAVLLRGLHGATDPYYCDTDSIICRSLSRVRMDDYELGAWKLEATGRMAAIGGKKLYAIFDRPNPTEAKHCIKKAHKGARLTGQEVLKIVRGGTVDACNPVPAFKWDGTHTFTKRTIRSTSSTLLTSGD